MRWQLVLLGVWASAATVVAWAQAHRITRLEAEQAAVWDSLLRLRRALVKPQSQLAGVLIVELEGLEGMMDDAHKPLSEGQLL